MSDHSLSLSLSSSSAAANAVPGSCLLGLPAVCNNLMTRGGMCVKGPSLGAWVGGVCAQWVSGRATCGRRPQGTHGRRVEWVENAQPSSPRTTAMFKDNKQQRLKTTFLVCACMVLCRVCWCWCFACFCLVCCVRIYRALWKRVWGEREARQEGGGGGGSSTSSPPFAWQTNALLQVNVFAGHSTTPTHSRASLSVFFGGARCLCLLPSV